MSEAKPKNLTTKLVEIMAEVDHVEKRGKNTAQNYAYVKATDLARAVRQELAKRNVLMLSSVVEAQRYQIPTKHGSMGAIDLKVLYTFVDGDSGESKEFYGYGTGADSGDKASYKAHTGALKYALRNTFLVPDESDPEADEKTDTETKGAGTSPKPHQPPKQAPKPSNKPSMVHGDTAKLVVSAINSKETKNGSTMWGFKTEQGWLNTFDPEIGNYVEKGGEYTFQIAEKNGYKNIVAIVDEADEALDEERGRYEITDDDIPF